MASARSLAVLLFAALVAFAVVCPPVVPRAHAQAASEAALLLRVLSYDRNLRRRANGEVTVLAVHGRSAASCGDIVGAINRLGRAIALSGMHARAVLTPYSGRDALVALARERRASVLYVCPGFEPDLEELTAATRAASLLSISGLERHVRLGVAVGIVRSSEATPRLVVNVQASEAEGARLDAALLRLATVIR